MSFISKLTATAEKNHSLLCVGLDPTLSHLPAGTTIEERLADWGKLIVEQTSDFVCCYKPNLAFYEQFGMDGLRGLQRILQAIPEGIPVLLDAKRGDIGSTAEAHAKAIFEQWNADAVTLNPYLGEDGVKPFLKYEGKTVFLLCYTSNPSAAQVQLHGEPPLFEHIAQVAQSWGSADQIGFVVGATQPEALARVRQICPQNWILAPGVGAQGGDLAASLRAGLRADGKGLIVPVSRAVMGAPDPRQAARTLCEQIANISEGLKGKPGWDTATREKLVASLFQTGCIQFGNFTLASGKQSPIYIDLRRVVSYPELFKLVTRLYADIVATLKFDRIAGVPYAALPTGAVVAWQLQRPFIYPRKEAKTHGTGQMIEGAFEVGQTTVILEDVITSGGSIVTSVDMLRQAGLLVKDVVVLVDREQGGDAKMAEIGLNLHAVISIGEIMNILKEKALIDTATYQSVNAYIHE
jgi:uridine monophosphate synthetase